jgi:Histidine kinase/Y_Y_Y domain
MYYKSGGLVLILITLHYANIYAIDRLELTKITTNYKNISASPTLKSIQLYSNSNDLFVEFKPIVGDSVNYKYQLKNYEMDWTETSYPTIRYMNLPKGNYQLFVTARKNTKELANYNLDIIVQNSISEHWWFYPMLAFYGILLIGGGIYLFFLYNFRQKMKVQKLRNKIAADLHDEVGSTLNSIGISTKIIQKKVGGLAPELQPILSQMETDSDETINMIRDTVWALNPENDSLDILIEKTHNFARQILGNKEINMIFENKIVKNKSVKLNIDNQKNFFLIAKEAINNIAKHSEATEAKMTYKMEGGMIHFEISDNGKGYILDEKFEGNGLKNFQKRAKESYMDLKIETRPQMGTKIKLLVPII